jgi:hypothetical protein
MVPCDNYQCSLVAVQVVAAWVVAEVEEVEPLTVL